MWKGVLYRRQFSIFLQSKFGLFDKLRLSIDDLFCMYLGVGMIVQKVINLLYVDQFDPKLFKLFNLVLNFDNLPI